MAIDFSKPRKTIRGPYTLFHGSVIVEFLEPDGIDATCLIKTTVIASHPLAKTGKKHPVSPPLHLHFSQSESFKILSGSFGITTGYEQTEKIITPESEVFVVPPMLPHIPWVNKDEGEDTVVLVWAHPNNVPKALDGGFFETVFLHVSGTYEQGKMPDLLQLMLSQHETDSCGVMFPGAWWLGDLRWWIPWKIQAMFAAIARWRGYTPLLEKVNDKKQK